LLCLLKKKRREAKLLYLIRQISTELVEKFIELGGHKCDSPADVGKGIAASECVVSYKAFETLRYMEMSSEHLI